MPEFKFRLAPEEKLMLSESVTFAFMLKNPLSPSQLRLPADSGALTDSDAVRKTPSCSLERIVIPLTVVGRLSCTEIPVSDAGDIIGVLPIPGSLPPNQLEPSCQLEPSPLPVNVCAWQGAVTERVIAKERIAIGSGSQRDLAAVFT